MPVGRMLEKAIVTMETRLYIGNLSKSTTQDDLNILFAQAGEVTATEVIRDRISGESRGFAFVTMSTKSEADKAVSLLDVTSLRDRTLKVCLAKPREQRGLTTPFVEP